jgi:hypothetical protein
LSTKLAEENLVHLLGTSFCHLLLQSRTGHKSSRVVSNIVYMLSLVRCSSHQPSCIRWLFFLLRPLGSFRYKAQVSFMGDKAVVSLVATFLRLSLVGLLALMPLLCLQDTEDSGAAVRRAEPFAIPGRGRDGDGDGLLRSLESVWRGRDAYSRVSIMPVTLP